MAYRRPPEDPDLALSSTRADWNGPGFSPGRFVFALMAIPGLVMSWS